MTKLHPSITDPKRMARRIAELTERVEQLEAQNLRFVNEAIAAVRGEYLEEPQNEEDRAYQRALHDAEQAIRAIIKETGDE